MSKLFGKKQMLGLLAAGAIVVTTAGSFAVWDQLEDTATGKVTLDKPVTVVATSADLNFNTGTRTLDQVNTYSTSIELTVAGVDELESPNLQLTPTVKTKGDVAITDGFEITIKENDTEVPGNKVDNIQNGVHTYNIELKPIADNTTVLAEAAAGNEFTVTVEGKLLGDLKAVNP